MFAMRRVYLAPSGRLLRVHQAEVVPRQKLVGEVVRRAAREEPGVREGLLERRPHPSADLPLRDTERPRQHPEQVVEQLAPYETVIDQAVMVLRGERRVVADPRAGER